MTETSIIEPLHIADVKINKNPRFEEDATMKNKHKIRGKKRIFIPLK
jgi:hypothetical protein